jgi:hypothetical protein
MYRYCMIRGYLYMIRGHRLTAHGVRRWIDAPRIIPLWWGDGPLHHTIVLPSARTPLGDPPVLALCTVGCGGPPSQGRELLWASMPFCHECGSKVEVGDKLCVLHFPPRIDPVLFPSCRECGTKQKGAAVVPPGKGPDENVVQSGGAAATKEVNGSHGASLPPAKRVKHEDARTDEPPRAAAVAPPARAPAARPSLSAVPHREISNEEIQSLVNRLAAAHTARNYKLADQLRTELRSHGDEPDCTSHAATVG